ncbi:uncharacterized protein RSE6_11798 [Rhynchosporium secalis]|uniref:Uncharacterized protein n=1 Tax=Rhynchosporium secalis TaxID=38038 RepID=A0A1E1MPT0_RHYSE|nr:uncharacterized protein RSE6_11798 [Rhynchosporium secalis]
MITFNLQVFSSRRCWGVHLTSYAGLSCRKSGSGYPRNFQVGSGSCRHPRDIEDR